jgi:transposase
VQRLLEQLKGFDQQVREIESEIVAWHRTNDDSRKLAKMPGIGPITASAMVASIGDAKSFKNGRQVSAWLGLVPKQNSTGGKTVLLGMSKRGDSYLRTLLIQGARSVIYALQRKKEPIEGWLNRLLKRRNTNVAAVALANKNARIIWALLSGDREFRSDYATAGALA